MSDVQGLLLILCTETTPGSARGPKRIPSIEPGSAVCKERPFIQKYRNTYYCSSPQCPEI